jgi:glutathione S-transferase
MRAGRYAGANPLIAVPMDQAGLTLYTFSISHFSEKIRWAMTVCNVPFREVVMTPAFHLIPMLRMGGTGRSLPPLLEERDVHGRRVHLEDSRRILAWLDERHGPLDILPQGAHLRDECLAIETRFELIGRDVARFLYSGGLAHEEFVLRAWTSHATPWETRVVRQLFPLLKWAYRRRLNLNKAAIARSEQRILRSLAWLEGRLSDGRIHLVGQRLSVADISAAAMLAPLACPRQHPLYGSERYIKLVRGQGGPWDMNRPAFVWVRKLYELHRGNLVLPKAA